MAIFPIVKTDMCAEENYKTENWTAPTTVILRQENCAKKNTFSKANLTENICYYKSGQIKEKGLFKRDKREGEYISYFKNGQIREKATYKNGNLTGKFLSFREDGTHADEDSGEDEDSKRIWEDKDIGNLLHDLSHFDKKQK